MLYSAFILGLLGSLHCLGMCGPIAFMLPVDRDHKMRSLFQTSLYHSGRLLAYGTMGALFGLMGSGLQMFGAQQALSITAGVLMIVLVVFPLQKLAKIRPAAPIYRAVQFLKESLGATFKKKTADAFLSIGFLNGFLPCGLVYMAVVGAAAMGSPERGFLYMAIFGAGTIPLMTLAIYFSKAIKLSFRQRIRRLIPVFVVIIGLLFILRGMGLGIPYVSPKVTQGMHNSTVECHNH